MQEYATVNLSKKWERRNKQMLGHIEPDVVAPNVPEYDVLLCDKNDEDAEIPTSPVSDPGIPYHNPFLLILTMENEV